MLSEEEKAFLELPQSQLALKLEKRDKDVPKPSIGQRIWLSRKGLLAASALIAGLVPLYELNVAAVNFVHTQIRVRNLLDVAESLLAKFAERRVENLAQGLFAARGARFLALAGEQPGRLGRCR